MKQLIKIFLHKLDEEKIDYQIATENDVTITVHMGPTTIDFQKDFLIITSSIAMVPQEKRTSVLECINTVNASFNYLRLCVESDELKIKTDCQFENITDIDRCIDRIRYLLAFISSFSLEIKNIL